MNFFSRWWTYQRERFPVVAHGLLIGAFSFCAVSLSRVLRQEIGWPDWRQLCVAFGTCFAFFLQLRIADEFKDYQEDLKYRPYRPVQRGLVSLRELGMLFVIACAVQLLLALWLDARLIMLLLVTWAYLAAMSKEFFVADWLRKRYILYMVSHMVIMPLVDLYATSTDWIVADRGAPRGLILFLGASYFNGLVIELGRKIRTPADEEVGVATYSHLWGRGVATITWLGAMVVTMAFACGVALRMDIFLPMAVVLGVALIGAIILGLIVMRDPKPGRGKWIEGYAGMWTLSLYLGLGLLPHFFGRGM